MPAGWLRGGQSCCGLWLQKFPLFLCCSSSRSAETEDAPGKEAGSAPLLLAAGVPCCCHLLPALEHTRARDEAARPCVPVPTRSPRQSPGAAKHAPPWQPAAASGFCSSKAWSGKRWRGNRKAHEGAQRPRRSAAASSFSLLSCLRCWWRWTWAWVGCRGRQGGRDVSPVI